MSLVSIARRPSILLSPPLINDANHSATIPDLPSLGVLDGGSLSEDAPEQFSDGIATNMPSAHNPNTVASALSYTPEVTDVTSCNAQEAAEKAGKLFFGSVKNEIDVVHSSCPSANYYTIKGAAVFLNSQIPSSINRPRTPVVKHAEISRHLRLMLDRLRDEDQMMMAARLESSCQNRARYLTLICLLQQPSSELVPAIEHTSCDESPAFALLGFDVTFEQLQTLENEADSSDASCLERVTLGLAVPLLGDTQIRLTGDGGFSISASDRSFSFKPVAVQVMWACLHSITEAILRAGRSVRSSSTSSSSAWLTSYIKSIDSNHNAIVDWQLMDDVISRLPDPGSLIQLQIRDQLRTLMSSIDLEEVSSRTIRSSLEEAMGLDLSSYRQFIDEEMLVLLGQLDLPSEIFDYLYLGSEWNASDVRVLNRLGITHVVNVSREIDNFFPSQFRYYNVRVFDDESTELLRYWDSVFKFVETARTSKGRVLVHCKMGVSRSAACVIAYCMKADGKSRDEAIEFVRSRRACVQPNKGFLEQLHVYEGILKASRVRHSDLFKRVDALVTNGTANLPSPTVSKSQAGRPMSFHEGSDNSLFQSCALNYSLGSRIAIFEPSLKHASSACKMDHMCNQQRSNNGQEAKTIFERRLRNRTSPGFTCTSLSSTLEFPLAPSYCCNNHKPVFVTGSKEDLTVAADSSAPTSDTCRPEAGHVRRVTAQLLAPNTRGLQALSGQKSSSDKCPIEARRLSAGMVSDEGPRNSWPLCQHDRAEIS